MKSIIQTANECYICGRQDGLQTHHCWHGPNRSNADADGLTVRLCYLCHMRLHDKGLYDRDLMEIAETAYRQHYKATKEDFIKRYGKSVVD